MYIIAWLRSSHLISSPAFDCQSHPQSSHSRIAYSPEHSRTIPRVVLLIREFANRLHGLHELAVRRLQGRVRLAYIMPWEGSQHSSAAHGAPSLSVARILSGANRFVAIDSAAESPSRSNHRLPFWTAGNRWASPTRPLGKGGLNQYAQARPWDRDNGKSRP